MELDLDGRCHPDPASGRKAGSSRKFAWQTHERDIRLTAGHDEPARGKHALLFPAQARDLTLEFHGLTRVFLGFLRDIAVEQGVILVLDLDHRRVQVKRQRIFNVVIVGRSVGIFIQNIDLPVHGPGDLVIRHHVRAGGHAVENQHLRACQLVHDKLAHIGVIAEEGRSVGKHDFLRDLPVIRRLEIEIRRKVHAIQLNDYTLGPVFLLQIGQHFRAQVFIVQNLLVDLLVGIG